MVSIFSLWLPILVSALFVFIASSIIHMALRYHKHDFAGIPEESKIMEAMGSVDIPPGDYFLPHVKDMKDMNSPEYVERFTKGPVVIMTRVPAGPPTMTKYLIMWFIYSIVVSIFTAYVAGRVYGPGTDYMTVFRLVSVVTFLSYSMAHWQNSIWYHRSWGTAIRNNIDGLIYGLVTGGVFGWLWV